MSPEQPQPPEQDTGFSHRDDLVSEPQPSQEQYNSAPPEPSKRSRLARAVGKAAVVLGAAGLLGSPSGGVAQHHELPEQPGARPELVVPPFEINKLAQPEKISTAELEKVISITNFESLKDHRVDVLGTAKTNNGLELTALSLDGAEPTVDLNELARAHDYFDQLAHKETSVNYTYNPGGQKKTVSYQLQPRAGRERFIIFAPEDQDFGQIDSSLTYANPRAEAVSLCSAEGCATILKQSNTPLGSEELDQRLNMNKVNSSIEACQAEIEVTGSYDPEFPTLGQENVCNGFGYAFRFAEAGFDYAGYSSFINGVGFDQYKALGANYYPVDHQTYTNIRHTVGEHI